MKGEKERESGGRRGYGCKGEAVPLPKESTALAIQSLTPPSTESNAVWGE